MYLEEDCEEISKSYDLIIDQNMVFITIKFIIIITIICQSFFPNKSNKLISEKSIPNIDDNNINIIASTIKEKDRIYINKYLYSIPEKYSI